MYDFDAEYREREHQRDLQRLRGLRPIDDDLMRCLFKDNNELVELVLRIIMDKPDLKVLHSETQADMKRVTGARSICLDAYATDSTGKKYDIEIQRNDHGAGVHRARYHASVMDVENLNAGEDFDALPDTYTIFITENDVHGDGEAVYLFERTNVKTGKPLNDGTHILYVNGQYRGESQIGRLMHDFSCTEPERMTITPLAERTRYFKENPKGVSDVCRVMEEMRNEAIAYGREVGRNEGRAEGRVEGHAEGREEGKAELGMAIVKTMLEEGMPIEYIAKLSHFPLETIKAWAGIPM